MKKSYLIVPTTLVIFAIMILPTSAVIKSLSPISSANPINEDYDPLVDKIIITVTIKEIRALKTIDLLSNPDFYVKVRINNTEFISDVWQNTKYVEQPNWSASCEVPKDKEFVDVTIELWDSNPGKDKPCDISSAEGDYNASLQYSVATGHWRGDDYSGDPSGYGRLNGCDDNSIYQQDRDCELWFDITQNDFDGDGIPYWTEVNVYGTDPTVDNRGQDADHDGVPIEWEWKHGYFSSHWHGGWIYNPFVWENHSSLDPDRDGLNNIEEYKTDQWGSDPFRQDMYIEIDQMEEGPKGQGSFVPVESYDLIRDSYSKHNIVWHIDDGRLGGGEIIPFKDNITGDDLDQWYWNYFMHGNASNWRRGVFRWAIIAYNGSWANGFTFGSDINGSFAIDCFLLSSKYHDSRVKHVPLIDSLVRRTFNRATQRAMIYAGAIMHETGHTLNAQAPGVDDWDGIWPWQKNFYKYGPYKSVMNYRYIYTGLVDYSDGSRGKNDYNDWGTIDLTYFNPRTSFQG